LCCPFCSATAPLPLCSLSLHDALPIFGDLGVGVVELLDLLGVDVLAAPDDHVLQAPGDLVVAVLVHAGQVPCVEPAVGLDGGGGDRQSTRLNSSHVSLSYAVFCLRKIN